MSGHKLASTNNYRSQINSIASELDKQKHQHILQGSPVLTRINLDKLYSEYDSSKKQCKGISGPQDSSSGGGIGAKQPCQGERHQCRARHRVAP
jgi:hypothetical protein